MADNEDQQKKNGYLRINDLEFFIPPTSISIASHNINFKFEPLRRAAAIKAKSGKAILQFTLNMIFTEVPREEITFSGSLVQLALLIHQVKYCPFISIDNEVINSTCGSKNVACTVQSITVSTIPEMPEALQVTLQLVFFNYKPFSSDFTYVNKFDKETLQTQQVRYQNSPEQYVRDILPYTPASIYNKMAQNGDTIPIAVASGYRSINPDISNLTSNDDCIYGDENFSPYQYYMYTGKRREKLQQSIVIDINGDIGITYYQYKVMQIPEMKELGITYDKSQEQILLPLSTDYVTWNSEVKPYIHKNVYDKFVAAFQEYHNLTGEKIHLTSCYRTHLQQVAEKTVASGKFSNHERGCAIDIQLASAVIDPDLRSKAPTGQLKEYRVSLKNYKKNQALFDNAYGIEAIRQNKVNNPPGYQQVGTGVNAISAKNWVTWIGIAKKHGINVLANAFGVEDSWHFEVKNTNIDPVINDVLVDQVPKINTSQLVNFFEDLKIKTAQATTFKIRQGYEDLFKKVYNILGIKVTNDDGKSLIAYLQNPMGFKMANINKDLINQLENLYRDAGKLNELSVIGEDLDKGWERIDRGVLRHKWSHTIKQHNPAFVVTRFAVSFVNNFAVIPLLGQVYPTHQYLGSQETAGSLMIQAIGAEGRVEFGRLSEVFYYQQDMATINRRITSKSPVLISHPLLKLIGLNEVMLDDLTVDTVPEMPEVLSCCLAFSENVQIMDWERPAYSSYGSEFPIQVEIYKYLIEKGKVYFTWKASRGWTGEYQGIEDFTEIKLNFDFVKTDDLIINKVLEKFCDTLNTLIDFKTITIDKWGILSLITNNYPSGIDYIKLEKANEEKYPDLMSFIQAFKKQIRTDILVGNYDDTLIIFYNQTILNDLILAKDPELLKIFQGLNNIGKLQGSPCYPDLDLPPNPITGSVYDTYPDFFFYNASDHIMMAATSSADDPWSSWLDGADDFMKKSYDTLRTQIFNDRKKEISGVVGQVADALEQPFFSIQQYPSNSPRMNPRPWEGIKLDIPNPSGGLVRTTKDSKNPINMTTDLMDLNASAEKLKEKGNIQWNRTSYPEWTNEYKAKTDTQKNRLKDLVQNYAGYSQALSVDAYQSVIDGKQEMPDGVALHYEFSPQNFSKLLKTDFKRDYYNRTLTMRRAYPTFKLYLIDEDTLDSEIGIKFTDDFYSINAVQSIIVTDDRKSALQVAIIEIINTDGYFTHKMFDHGFIKEKVPAGDPREELTYQETSYEDDMKNMAIKDGTKLQICLGYSNDPQELTTVFNGRIVSIEGSSIVTLVCQSYGDELIAKRYGYDKSQTNWWAHADTDEILTGYLCMPECVHFGRFLTVPSPALGYYEKIQPDGNTITKWMFTKETADDNIFAQPRDAYYNHFWGTLGIMFGGKGLLDIAKSVGMSLLAAGILAISSVSLVGSVVGLAAAGGLLYWYTGGGWLDYIPNNLTIFEIFKEMELRSPGWISHPVPYEGRMTMFFGTPNMRYFYRDPQGIDEKRADAVMTQWRTIGKYIHLNEDMNSEYNKEFLYDLQVAKWSQTDPQIKTYTNRQQEIVNNLDSGIFEILAQHSNAGKPMKEFLLDYRTKPFRQYHMVTSENDIISNNIRADNTDTCNQIKVFYNNKNAAENRDSKGDLDLQKTSYASTTVLLDDNLPSKAIREKEVIEVNAQGGDMGLRYGIGHLWRETKDYYRGELIIIGNEKIKPYHTIFILDSFNDIVGPIEVQKVTHIFQKDTGFITEIIPDMCSTVNEAASKLLGDAINQVFTVLGTKILGASIGGISGNVGEFGVGASPITIPLVIGATALFSPVAPLTAAALVGVGSIALLTGGISLIRMTQGRHPVIITPLLKNGKPYVAGLQAYGISGLCSHYGAYWTQWYSDMDLGAKFYGRNIQAAWMDFARLIHNM